MLARRKEEFLLSEENTASPRIKTKSNQLVATKRKFFVIIGLIALMAMFVTYRNESIVRAGYDLVRIKSEVARLEKENELIRLEIAKLKSPSRIQAIAATQLGMVVPSAVYHASVTEVPKETNLQDRNGKNIIDKIAVIINARSVEAGVRH